MTTDVRWLLILIADNDGKVTAVHQQYNIPRGFRCRASSSKGDFSGCELNVSSGVVWEARAVCEEISRERSGYASACFPGDPRAARGFLRKENNCWMIDCYVSLAPTDGHIPPVCVFFYSHCIKICVQVHHFIHSIQQQNHHHLLLPIQTKLHHLRVMMVYRRHLSSFSAAVCHVGHHYSLLRTIIASEILLVDGPWNPDTSHTGEASCGFGTSRHDAWDDDSIAVRCSEAGNILLSSSQYARFCAFLLHNLLFCLLPTWRKKKTSFPAFSSNIFSSATSNRRFPHLSPPKRPTVLQLQS